MLLQYDVVDVFTDRPFAGNQLAVVHGAGELSSPQCLALAQEFGFSETTFPVPSEAGGDYFTRIFTPGGEIPFAGHPTLGTAWVLRAHGLLRGDSATQRCGAGEIGVSFSSDAPDALVELTAAPRDLIGPLPDDLVAALLADLGLAPEDVTGPVYVAGTGLSFVHLPVTEEAVLRAHASLRPLTDYADRFAAVGDTRDPIDGVNVVAVSGEAPELAVHSRVFVPGLSVPEDPATGSAAAGLGMALVAAGLLPAGGSYAITQGVEMGRPSALSGRVEVADDVVVRVRVAGQVWPVASGEIVVPPA